MSQVYKSLVSGPVPPTVATSYVADSGVAVPAGNILNVPGGSTFQDDADGIMTFGSGNTLSVQLTNRSTGTGTTNGAVNTNLASYVFIAPAACYTFDLTISGYDSANVAGVSFKIFGMILADGATTSVVGTPDKIQNKSALLVAADANLVSAGATVNVQVTGVGGSIINWNFVSYYTKVA